MQRLAERKHIGFAGVIDRHAGTGHECRDGGDVEDAAAPAFEAVDEAEREFGERAHVDVDHGELLGAVEGIRRAEEAEARIVDDHVRLDAAALEGGGDRLRGIVAPEICGQNRRPRHALPCNGVRQRIERLLASCD